MEGIYAYEVERQDGTRLSLAELKGKVMLIVNTATGCGFTPQYEGLENLYEKYGPQGLVILDIPCNQFGRQAPGTDAEITGFCSLHYHTTFEQMKKAEVNGDGELPLYTYLKAEKPFDLAGHPQMAGLIEMTAAMTAERKPSDIQWNFTKFLVTRDGRVDSRWEPMDPMDAMAARVAELLA